MLIPVNDKIIVTPVEAAEKVGAIFIPDANKEKPQRGIVVEAGPGRLLESGIRQPIGAKVGDEVLFGKYSGSEFEHEDVKYLVLDEGDILAIIRG